jgi:hypothetical protein
MSGRLAGGLAHHSVHLLAWATASPPERHGLCLVMRGLPTAVARPIPGHVHNLRTISGHASSRG